MKALELLKNQENLIPEELQSKKVKSYSITLNSLMEEMNNQFKSFSEFKNDQTEGELANKIIITKSLAEFYQNNKILRLDLVAENYRNQEKSKINEFYSIKTKLLDTLNAILKESQKEAVVSAFDVFEDEFKKCESGHEIIILNGRNTGVLEQFIKELDEQIIINGNYDNLDAQNVDYSTEVLDRNIELCNRKNNEINGSKAGKLNKFEAMINKLQEVGKQVVAFYTYKETLIDIGCNPKSVKVYENELSKSYIPLKKVLQKEFKIELEDICDVKVNEDEYSENIEVDTPNSWETEQYSPTTYDEEPVQNTSYASHPLDETLTPTPIEEETQTNPFESNSFETQTQEPLGSIEPDRVNSNPLEANTNSNPFENNSNESNPFISNTIIENNSDDSNPFISNTFDNNSNNSNPFTSNTTSINPFENNTNNSNETLSDNNESLRPNPFSNSSTNNYDE